MTFFEGYDDPPRPRDEHPAFAELRRRDRRRRAMRGVALALVAIAVVGLGGWAVTQSGVLPRDAIGMPWDAPTPAPDALAVVDRLQLTDEGREILFHARPTLASAAEVEADCGRDGGAGDGDFSVLGCYYHPSGGLGGAGRIAVYRPDDDRVSGLMVTFMAHEFLHAAYDAMSAEGRQEVDDLVAAEVARIPADDGVHAQIESSAGGDDAVLGTERFAYLGSEVALDGGFAPRLEEVYARFFRDRAAIVDVYRSTEAAIEEVFAELARAVDELSALEQANAVARARYEADLSANRLGVAQYNADADRYNAMDPAERSRWMVTTTAADGTTTTTSWEQSLADRLAELDAQGAELERRGGELDAAEAQAVSRRTQAQAQYDDAVRLLRAAYPGSAAA